MISTVYATLVILCLIGASNSSNSNVERSMWPSADCSKVSTNDFVAQIVVCGCSSPNPENITLECQEFGNIIDACQNSTFNATVLTMPCQSIQQVFDKLSDVNDVAFHHTKQIRRKPVAGNSKSIKPITSRQRLPSVPIKPKSPAAPLKPQTPMAEVVIQSGRILSGPPVKAYGCCSCSGSNPGCECRANKDGGCYFLWNDASGKTRQDLVGSMTCTKSTNPCSRFDQLEHTRG